MSKSAEALGTRLSAKFDPSLVKSRKGGGGKQLSYVSINDYVNRVIAETGIEDVKFEITERSIDGPFETNVRGQFGQNRSWTTKLGKKHTVTIAAALTIAGSTREGVGSDDVESLSIDSFTGELVSQVDMDKANKTALSEAFKKACFYFGIGTYLWDKEEKHIVQEDEPSVRSQVPNAQATSRIPDEAPAAAAEEAPVKVKTSTPTEAPTQASAPVASVGAVYLEAGKLTSFAISEIAAIRNKLGFGRAEMGSIVKEFMKKKHNKDVTGTPECLIAETNEDTKKNVDSLIGYMREIAGSPAA